MTTITISDKDYNDANIYYIQTGVGELLTHAECSVKTISADGRKILKIDCPEYYFDIIKTELADKIAEVIAIKYKYEYFKRVISVGGLSLSEREILLASLIAADLDDDKKYCFDRIKQFEQVPIDGIYNFRLKPLKRKWEDVANCIPACFFNAQLKEFIFYLLENKKKRVYIDGGKVYDNHYRRLKRSTLLDGEDMKIIREILLSNCGEVELSGKIPEKDEYYLKEYYNDKIIFSCGYPD